MTAPRYGPQDLDTASPSAEQGPRPAPDPSPVAVLAQTNRADALDRAAGDARRDASLASLSESSLVASAVVRVKNGQPVRRETATTGLSFAGVAAGSLVFKLDKPRPLYAVHVTFEGAALVPYVTSRSSNTFTVSAYDAPGAAPVDLGVGDYAFAISVVGP